MPHGSSSTLTKGSFPRGEISPLPGRWCRHQRVEFASRLHTGLNDKRPRRVFRLHTRSRRYDLRSILGLDIVVPLRVIRCGSRTHRDRVSHRASSDARYRRLFVTPGRGRRIRKYRCAGPGRPGRSSIRFEVSFRGWWGGCFEHGVEFAASGGATIDRRKHVFPSARAPRWNDIAVCLVMSFLVPRSA